MANVLASCNPKNSKMPQPLTVAVLSSYSAHILNVPVAPVSLRDLHDRFHRLYRLFFSDGKHENLGVLDIAQRAVYMAAQINAAVGRLPPGTMLPVRFMDGHGRFLVLLLIQLVRLGNPLNRVQIVLVDIDPGVVAYHRQVFPIASITHIQGSVTVIPTAMPAIHPIVYMNFCGIASQLPAVWAFLAWWLANAGAIDFIVVSFSTGRAASRLNLVGQFTTWATANGVNAFPMGIRQTFLTVYITRAAALAAPPVMTLLP